MIEGRNGLFNNNSCKIKYATFKNVQKKWAGHQQGNKRFEQNDKTSKLNRHLQKTLPNNYRIENSSQYTWNMFQER